MKRDLKSAIVNITLKFVILGIFALALSVIGLIPISFWMGILGTIWQWILVIYIILIIEEYCLGYL